MVKNFSMIKDNDKIKRFSGCLDKLNIDLFISSHPIYIRYLTGALIDYSYVLIDKKGTISVLCNIMEMDRARKLTCADDIYGYTTGEYRDKNVFSVSNPYEALKKMIQINYGDQIKIGLDYSYEGYTFVEKIKDVFGQELVCDVHEYIMKVRMIKSEVELNNIKGAIKIIIDGIKYTKNILNEGKTERDIYIEADYYMKGVGAERVYDFLIVASGPNSANPHSRPENKKIFRNEPVNTRLCCCI